MLDQPGVHVEVHYSHSSPRILAHTLMKGVLRDHDDEPQGTVLPQEPQGNITRPIL